MKSFWSDELERMNRMLRDLAGLPNQNVLRELERQRQFLEPPGLRALFELQDNIAAEARRVNEGLAVGFSSIVGQYDVLKALGEVQYPKVLAADLQRAFQAFQPPALPAIESFADQLSEISRNFEALRQFQSTFAGQLLEITRDLAIAPEGEVEERVENLAEFLGTHLAESKSGPISLEGYVQIILALILYIHGVVGVQQSEERLMKHLSNIAAQLEAIAAVEPVERTPELRLVSASSLRIRSGPSTESRIVGKLTRNALVRIINKEKSWAHVEYFDFVEGRTCEGWVAHRFMQHLLQDTHPRRTGAEEQAARERFERHFGEVDLGYATGVDNEQIDADLAGEYAGTDQPR